MSGYTPKVGDKVRATLGENVLVGTIVTVAGASASDRVFYDIAFGEDQESMVRVFGIDGWRFEQVVSVPSKFGAVIRRADGEAFVLTNLGSDKRAADWLTDTGERWADEGRATQGGFSVLFDGVDE